MHTIARFASVLFAWLLLCAAAGPAAARPAAPPPYVPREPRIALVIGNADYADAIKLANPAKDAALIGATLERLGFEVILVTNAAQKPMQRAIVRFGDRLAEAGPNAVGLFYYAGHGLQLDGQNFLVPTDADISREVDVEINGVSADLILKQMAYGGSRVNIVILDACRNNPLARDFRSVAPSQGFAEIRTKPKGTFISYSTAPGEVAVDGDGDHSPFAEAVAASMQLPGLDLAEVFQRVREQVLAATDDRQTPWDSSSLVKSFYFIPPAGERAKDDLIAAAEPAQAEPPVLRLAEAGAAPAFVTQTRSLFAKPGSRLRAEPSKDAAILAKLPANAELHAVARSKDGAWWQVATRAGAIAYVHAEAVSDFRAARPLPAPRMPVAAAQQAAQPAAGKRAGTGIGLVDNALNWLEAASGAGQNQQNPVRASR
ncbi:caspase family protein [Dongia sp.]|uniref:caspase family protein n=1 Tax=Dongia sp. TaxID=1977262 RepID=UPI003753D904